MADLDDRLDAAWEVARYAEKYKQRDFETLTDELNYVVEATEDEVPCWANPDPSKPDFPDPPHWTTKAWRCAFKRRKKWPR